MNELEHKIRELLKGIDLEDTEPYGWWETSYGAKFGKETLEKLIELVRWIPVEERMPTFREREYLVKNGQATLICGLLPSGTFYGITGATHWKEIN